MATTLFYTDQPNAQLHASKPVGLHQRCDLVYLNEGGANFVFVILSSDPSEELPPKLQGKLLRLRKYLPHAQASKETLAAFDQHFKLLFQPENLVQFELIDLDQGVPSQINAMLRSLHRPSHRHHEFLPENDRHGLLLTDMTPKEGDILLQLKPKWLAQSPSAPLEAKRCRTCALRARRASHQVRTATDAQATCPLKLVSEVTVDREQTAEAITSDEQLRDYLVNEARPVLLQLRLWQSKLDPEGILQVKDEQTMFDYCKAMTLRDCTLFLRRSGGQIEARFADLDIKQPEKFATWKKVEHELISGGWYTNTENEAFRTTEQVCRLSNL